MEQQRLIISQNLTTFKASNTYMTKRQRTPRLKLVQQLAVHYHVKSLKHLKHQERIWRNVLYTLDCWRGRRVTVHVPATKATSEASLTVENGEEWYEKKIGEANLSGDPNTSCRELLANLVLALHLKADQSVDQLLDTTVRTPTSGPGAQASWSVRHGYNSGGPQHGYNIYLA